jgi:hypothetical protein
VSVSTTNEVHTAEHPILRAVDTARASGELLVLTGNVADIYLSAELRPRRLNELIAEHLERMQVPSVLWRRTEGTTTLGTAKEITTLPRITDDVPAAEAVVELAHGIRDGRRGVVIIDFLDLYLGPGDSHSEAVAALTEALLAVPRHPAYVQNSDTLLIVVAASVANVGPLLANAGVRHLHVALPSAAERRTMIEILELRHVEQPDRFAPLADSFTIDDAVRLSTGLRCDDLLRLHQALASTGGAVQRLDIRRRSAEALCMSASDGLETIIPVRTFDDIAGLHGLKAYVDALLSHDRWPAGVLLAGPPGVGKSLVVEAMANVLGCNLAKLHLVRSSLVGESERRMAAVLSELNSRSPAVLWIDEIDLKFPRQYGSESVDGGTSERMYSMLLEATESMAEDFGVLVVATTNYPYRVQPALRSRFTMIPILEPSSAERVEFVDAVAQQLGTSIAADVDKAALVASRSLAAMSGRDLVRMLDTAKRWQAQRSPGPLTSRVLAEAIDDVVVSHSEDRVRMALEALAVCPSRHLYPWRAGATYRAESVPDFLQPIVDTRGWLREPQFQDQLRRYGCDPQAWEG